MSIFNGRFFAKSIHSQTLRMTICSVLAPFWLVLVWLAPSCSTGYSPGPLTLRLVLGGGRNFQRDRPRDPRPIHGDSVNVVRCLHRALIMSDYNELRTRLEFLHQ